MRIWDSESRVRELRWCWDRVRGSAFRVWEFHGGVGDSGGGLGYPEDLDLDLHSCSGF